jgi:hypothetical protein
MVFAELVEWLLLISGDAVKKLPEPSQRGAHKALKNIL